MVASRTGEVTGWRDHSAYVFVTYAFLVELVAVAFLDGFFEGSSRCPPWNGGEKQVDVHMRV